MTDEDVKVYDRIKLFWAGIGVTVMYGLLVMMSIWLMFAVFLSTNPNASNPYARNTDLEQYRENVALNGIPDSKVDDYDLGDDISSGNQDAMRMQLSSGTSAYEDYTFNQTAPSVHDDEMTRSTESNAN